MDKVILDQDQWLYLTDQGAAPINYADLPYRFILLLNPPLYLCHKDQEKVMWSPFQEQALSELQQSQHQIISSYYIGQFADGQPNGEILQIKGMESIACIKRQDILFQATDCHAQAQIQAYLKRFDINFMPQATSFKKLKFTSVLRARLRIIPQLQLQHVKWWDFIKVNMCLTIIVGALAIGSLLAVWDLAAGQHNLAQYAGQSSLTLNQQAQARLYQSYVALTANLQKIDWSQYNQFATAWRSKIVITQLRYDHQSLSCQFIMHPDFTEEREGIREWLDKHISGAQLMEEGKVELRLHFTAR